MSSQIVQEPNAEQRFWLAAEQGIFLLPRCKDTGKCFFYPRDHSPFTGGEVEWLEASGKGTVYACCVNVRSERPFCIAYIELDEGPIILSNVVADDLMSVSIGQRVEVFFQQDKNGKASPFFTLLSPTN